MTIEAEAVVAARAFARRLADDLAVPTFLYDDADPGSRSLPTVRRDAFGARAPDHGPARPHPTFGAVAVGARPPLVAVNCVLGTDDLARARAIASFALSASSTRAPPRATASTSSAVAPPGPMTTVCISIFTHPKH